MLHILLKVEHVQWIAMLCDASRNNIVFQITGIKERKGDKNNTTKRKIRK